MPFLPDLSDDASLLEVFRRYPESCRHLIAQHESLMRGPSPFSPAERELLAAYVSALNGCRYCFGIHAAVAERLGIAPGLAQSLTTDPEAGAVDARLRPVLKLARRLTMTPTVVRKADADAVLAMGWGADGLYQAVAIVALFNQMNRLVEGLGIELAPDYLAVAAGRLADRGYGALLQMLARPG